MHFVVRVDDGSLRITPHVPTVPAALAAAEIAAAYASGISKVHSSVDSKRTAFVTALTILRLSGFSFRPDPIEGVQIMDNVTACEVTESDFAKWLSFGKTRV